MSLLGGMFSEDTEDECDGGSDLACSMQRRIKEAEQDEPVKNRRFCGIPINKECFSCRVGEQLTIS